MQPGSQPLVLVAAAVIIEQGRVLLSQRKTGTHLAGAWEFPGGKVESDEDPRDALTRELLEELGVRASVGRIFEVTFHRYPAKNVLLLFYETTLTADSPAPAAIDVAAVRWAAVHDLVPEHFPPADLAVLDRVREQLSRA